MVSGDRPKVFIVVLGLLSALLAQAIAIPLVSADEGLADAVDAAAAADFRAWAELDATSATVAESLAAGSAYTDLTFGIPLTPAERDKVSALTSTQDRLVSVIQAAEREAGYVSSYLERSELVVLTSERAAPMEAALSSMTPPDGSLRVVETGNTRKELESAKADLLNATPTGVISIGIGDREGVVVVGIEPGGTAAARGVEDRYGALVRVEEEQPVNLLACTRHDCGTLGGLTGKQTNVLGENKCTTAFIIKWGSSSHKMLTAGHCIKKFGLASPTKWKNGVGTVTWGVNRAFDACDGCNTDSGIFDIETVPADRDQYFLASGPRDLVGTYLDSALPVGKQICGTRSVSGYGCGLITQRDVSVDVVEGNGQYWVHHSWVIGLKSTTGDSGAGMVGFNSGDDILAAGVLFGGNTIAAPWKTYFSSIQRVQAYHGISVCITNAC